MCISVDIHYFLHENILVKCVQISIQFMERFV